MEGLETTGDLALTPHQAAVAHELGRRRVYLFTLFFYFVGTLAAVTMDTGLRQQVVDLVMGVVVLAAFVVIGLGWRRQSPAGLRRQHDILFGLTLALVLLLPLNFDVGRLLFSAVLVLNRLL